MAQGPIILPKMFRLTRNCQVCLRVAKMDNYFTFRKGKSIPLKEKVATHSRILAWKTPWTEEPGGLQPKGSQRDEHDQRDLA